MARPVTRRAALPASTHPGPASTVDRGESAAPRVRAIDALRGMALCLMFVYHFTFDLRFFRMIDADFEHDIRWLAFRAVIVASFMSLVGISIVLADSAGTHTPQFLRRLAVIALAALAVTLASWVMFPASFIYFGILHCIVLTSLIAWPLRRSPRIALAIGVAVMIAGLVWSSPFFDVRGWSWLGFMTHKPVTEDYVPLAPWAGATFVGIALGHALMRANFRPLSPLNGAPGWLRWLGRHSLVVYLAHQPLLLGLLWLMLGHGNP